MSNPLANVPFLGGYLARREQNEMQPLRDLHTAAQVASLGGMLKKQRAQEEFQREVAALGPEPTQEALTAVASKYADPAQLLDAHQKSLDRKASNADRALQFAQNLDLRQQQLELAKEQFNQRTSDAAARLQFETFYKNQSLQNKTAMDQLNVQLRLMGLEIQKQGNALSLERFDAQKRDKEEREIEGAIGKTADRMKDVTPVFTAAKQLNDTLSLYTPDNVPGVGYWKNTDIGKLILSDQGKDVSSKIKLFGNSVLKAMSGAAVTAPEEVRQMAAQMADGRFSAHDFFVAWPTMSAWVNDQVALSTAGLTPKARERFIDRTGLKLDPISPRFTFDAKAGVLKDSRAPAPSTGSAVPPPPPGFRVQ